MGYSVALGGVRGAPWLYGRCRTSALMTGGPETSAVAVLVAEAVRNHLLDISESASGAYDQFLEVAARLRAHRGAAIDCCEALFRSDDAAGRAAAVDLFGRLAYDAPAREAQRCLRDLETALESETTGAGDVDVLSCIVSSFSHIGQPESLPFVLRLAQHPEACIRRDVAMAIPAVAGDEPAADAVAALVELSADADSDVRDWACFGLGQIDADSLEVRDALAARLNDTDTDTRCEALAALAQLGDQRARHQVDQRLAAGALFALEIEAAAALGDVRWHDQLIRLRSEWETDDDFDYWKPRLDAAIGRCDPEQHHRASQVEATLAAALAARLEGTGSTATMTGSYPQTRLVVVDSRAVVMLDERVWQPDQLPADLDVELQPEEWLAMLTSIERT